jgi:nucleoside-diphosphate-sugar epimerase
MRGGVGGRGSGPAGAAGVPAAGPDTDGAGAGAPPGAVRAPDAGEVVAGGVAGMGPGVPTSSCHQASKATPANKAATPPITRTRIFMPRTVSLPPCRGQTVMDAMLLIFGLGYSGKAVARAAHAAGWRVLATSRQPGITEADNIALVPFTDAAAAVRKATHLLATAPPGADGDPVLALHAAAIRAAPSLRWIGYLSTTGVYGDRAGGWVDEASSPAPNADRSARRLRAEDDWRRVADSRATGVALDIFRLAGIYGPGRSVFDDFRAGRARRIVRPGHQFGRIHRDDIAGAVLAAMRQDRAPGPRILNLADDEPAASADVVAEAARLLGIAPPPDIPFAEAWEGMSPMARSFWAENRKVSSRATQAALGYRWRYRSYREGLAAILAEELAQDPG